MYFSRQIFYKNDSNHGIIFYFFLFFFTETIVFMTCFARQDIYINDSVHGMFTLGKTLTFYRNDSVHCMFFSKNTKTKAKPFTETIWHGISHVHGMGFSSKHLQKR